MRTWLPNSRCPLLYSVLQHPCPPRVVLRASHQGCFQQPCCFNLRLLHVDLWEWRKKMDDRMLLMLSRSENQNKSNDNNTMHTFQHPRTVPYPWFFVQHRTTTAFQQQLLLLFRKQMTKQHHSNLPRHDDSTIWLPPLLHLPLPDHQSRRDNDDERKVQLLLPPRRQHNDLRSNIMLLDDKDQPPSADARVIIRVSKQHHPGAAANLLCNNNHIIIMIQQHQTPKGDANLPVLIAPLNNHLESKSQVGAGVAIIVVEDVPKHANQEEWKKTQQQQLRSEDLCSS
mmetsp:Transcript_48162/g.71805  ORF Transcript_48162/g.71805 Transcript_48162/m.71805 type:complete len:284 (+) Transcript_48162:204-1055(+)